MAQNNRVEDVTRYKMTIEYDGTRFAGWQRQAGAMSVQEAIENAISCFIKQKVTVFCAGRTDAGVHALGQVAHCDIDDSKISAFSIMSAINFHLRPYPVSVLHIEPVQDDWHARFSAVQKAYVYKIINRQARLALDRNRALHIKKPLDIDKMLDARHAFIGMHNFCSFRSSECQAKSPVRSIDYCEIRSDANNVEIEFKARSFLHNQVRIMVGCLVEIGLGEKHDIAQIIASEDRTKAPATAPAHGLYMKEVIYI